MNRGNSCSCHSVADPHPNALDDDGHARGCEAGEAVRLRDALDLLIAVSGLQVSVVVDPGRLRPADVPRMVGSNQKLRATVAWSATVSLEQSLRDLYESSME